ncbi:hypothetical protein BKA69DRAFT_854325 [Paraphysoderma sedebokerense]|nr:hypothetical protein BKA69DRAFT_854325 [Paraphysoderma sedebokerense]
MSYFQMMIEPTQAAPQPAQGVSWDFESASDSSVNTATAHLRAELANVAQQQRFMQQQQQQRDAENGASSANTPIYSPASAGSTELVNGNGTAAGQGQVYGLGIAGNGGQQQHGGMASAVSQMEIRKGRFSVSEGQPGESSQMAGGDSQSSSTPPSLERRSRFEVTTSNSGGGQQPQQGQGDPAGVAPAATRRGRFEVSNVDDGSGSPPTITRAQSLRKDSASAAGAGSVTLNGPGNGLSIGIGGQAQMDRLQSQVETLHRRNEELVKLVGVLIERLGGTNSANVVGTFNQRFVFPPLMRTKIKMIANFDPCYM